MTIHQIDLHAAAHLGPFDIIVADPAWRFASNSAAKPGRNAMRHYACMTVPQIAALPVRDMAAPDALLLLWITVPFTRHAFDVIDAWGFRYASELVWPKARIGTGYWARTRHEKVIIARRGKFPCLRPAIFPDSVIPGHQGAHSVKPDWLHEVIDARFPDARKAELFARRARAGWTCIGNEVTA